MGPRDRAIVGLAALAALATAVAPASALTPTVTEYVGGVTLGFAAGKQPAEITTGPDGNLWFAEGNGGVGRITPSGQVTEFTQGITVGDVRGIATGSDGNLWFTERNPPGAVGKITPTGTVTEYVGGTVPGFKANRSPSGITTGPDGNLWVTEQGGFQMNQPGGILRVTPAGGFTSFTNGTTPGLTSNGGASIHSGPDGDLWFAEQSGKVGRITPAGAVTEYDVGLTLADLTDAYPMPDGKVWFTGTGSPGHLGVLDPATGTHTLFTGGVTPGFSADPAPSMIVPGPGGAVYFTEEGGTAAGHGAIVRVSSSGQFTELRGGTVPGFSADTVPIGITVGPDGNLWFAEFWGPGAAHPGAIARITTPPVAATGAAAVATKSTATVAGTANGHSQPTSVRFEYGPTTAYGQSTSPQTISAANADTPAAATLTGLTPGVTYHYRILATNPTDTTAGADATITMPGPPRLSDVHQSHAKWRLGHRTARLTAASAHRHTKHKQRKKKVPVGTSFHFTLDQAATVTLTFTRRTSGRRDRHHRCVPVSKRNHKRHACTRTSSAGTLTESAHAGTGAIAFQGVLAGHRRLKPGAYTVQITATSALGNVSAPATLRFTVITA